MASSRPLPPPPSSSSKHIDLEITIVSAKNLKNVNWKHGDLKPYVIFWLDPDRRLATKPDDSGSTRPVWNERFTLPINQPFHDSLLTLEIFHSKPSETPKPLVGTLRFLLKDVVDSEDSSAATLKTLELRRPSGRPQGKIRVKLAVRERPAPPAPDYHITPPPAYYYSSAPPPPPPSREYRGGGGGGYAPSPYPANPIPQPAPSPAPAPAPSSLPHYQYGHGGYSDPYSGYYSGYYSQPQLPPRPFYDRGSVYGGPSGPSAPVDFSGYDHQKHQKGSKMGLGAGLAVGAVAGALGGMALEEGLKYEEEKIADKVESDYAARDDYSEYHRSEY